MFEFNIKNTEKKARAWEFFTEHGSFKTPVFMPVWTKATVKWICREDLYEMGAEIILNNTYHLYLRPGDEVIKEFWGVHKFQNYNKPILTDSWWFQVFSLGLGNRKSPHPSDTPLNKGGQRGDSNLAKITEKWVHFRSVIDWSKHYFDAENVMDIQSEIQVGLMQKMQWKELTDGL